MQTKMFPLFSALWFVCLMCLLASDTLFVRETFAAEVRRETQSFFGPDILKISGAIVYGDFERVREAVGGTPLVIVVLDSPGGKLGPAIEIAQYIKASGFLTYVEDGVECRSACSVIWLSGRRKFLENGGIVGFHAPVQGDGKETAPEISHALFGWALGDLGIPEEVIMRIYDGDVVSVKDYSTVNLVSIGIDFTNVPRGSLLTVANSLSEEISSAEYGAMLSRLKGQTPEPDHFPSVEIISAPQYAEFVRSGTASRLTEEERVAQDANLGFLTAENSLDLLLRNSSQRELEGLVLACTVCSCKSLSYLFVQFPQTVPQNSVSRIAFSEMSIRQIIEEFGVEQIDCMGAVGVLN